MALAAHRHAPGAHAVAGPLAITGSGTLGGNVNLGRNAAVNGGGSVNGGPPVGRRRRRGLAALPGLPGRQVTQELSHRHTGGVAPGQVQARPGSATSLSLSRSGCCSMTTTLEPTTDTLPGPADREHPCPQGPFTPSHNPQTGEGLLTRDQDSARVSLLPHPRRRRTSSRRRAPGIPVQWSIGTFRPGRTQGVGKLLPDREKMSSSRFGGVETVMDGCGTSLADSCPMPDPRMAHPPGCAPPDSGRRGLLPKLRTSCRGFNKAGLHGRHVASVTAKPISPTTPASGRRDRRVPWRQG